MAGNGRLDALGLGGADRYRIVEASGPSRMPPLIWPRSAILQRAAASSVDWIFGLTVSTAERIATFGSS